jgi:cytochrome oxidase Cu insertion factor (SCO1/SenC/PrrC family)
VICGRSSWAPAATAENSNPAVTAHTQILRCSILRTFGSLEYAAIAAPDLTFPGEIPMKVNDKAPDFTLQDENEKEVALKDLRGKTVVLFFYPKANTPG